MNNPGTRLFDVKLAYITPAGPDYVRTEKCTSVFGKLFREVHVICSSRGKRWDQRQENDGIHYHVEERDWRLGARSLPDLLGFLRYIRTELNKVRPDVVVATNEEYVVPFAAGYLPQPDYLVCDLIDSLTIRINGPLRRLNPLWALLADWAKTRMDGMVEVTEERLARHRLKPGCCTVIFNSPEWREINPEPNLPSPSVYACGSLQDGVSGAETLLAAVEQVPDIRIIFAGRVLGPWLNKHFLKHPRVLNLGEVSPARSLSIAKSCRAVFAHYRPSIMNNVYAAPNKFFEAMMLGTPLLINQECKISALAAEAGFGIVTPFGDVKALKGALRNLAGRDPVRQEKCEIARKIFREKYSWQNMEQRWVDFFRTLGVPMRVQNLRV